MKNRFLILVAALVASCVFNSQAWSAPSSAGQEAALIRQIELSWEKTRTFLRACVLSDDCPLSPDELLIAKKIVANDKAYSKSSIQIVLEKDKPGFFSSVDGDPHRLMMTGLDPSTPLYVNGTRLLQPALAVSFETLCGLFAHELVHHLGIKDEANRIPDQFGARVAMLIRQNMVPINLGIKETSAFLLNFPQPILPEFANQFRDGLFPTIVLIQAEQVIVQELSMMRKEASQICAAQEVLWSSAGLVTGTAKGSDQINVSLQFNSRCLNQSPPSLQEVITYGQTRIQFDPARADYITQGVVSFSRTPVDPSAASWLEVDVTKSPLASKAGEEIVIEAGIRASQPQVVTGCGALVGSASWTDSPAANPLSIQADSCKVLSATGGTQFQVQVRLNVPIHAEHGTKLQVQAVALQLKTGKWIRGIPSQVTTISIENPGASAPRLTTVKSSVTGATPLNPTKFKNAFYVMRGTPFTWTLEIQGSSAAKLVDGYVEYQAKMLDGTIMQGARSLLSQPTQCRTGANLTCDITMNLQKLNDSHEVVVWAPQKLLVLTSDYQFLAIDLSSDELMVMAVEKAPQ